MNNIKFKSFINEEDSEKDELLEKLAGLEHDQWIEWAKNILDTENITKERADRWKNLFVPYDELTEEMKEKDREYARRVLDIINTGDNNDK